MAIFGDYFMSVDSFAVMIASGGKSSHFASNLNRWTVRKAAFFIRDVICPGQVHRCRRNREVDIREYLRYGILDFGIDSPSYFLVT